MPQKSRGCQGVALDVPEYGKSPNSLYINVYVYTKEHYCTSMDAPVQFDDPAHEVRVGLLPERFATLAEELVDQGRDAVGERIGVEQRIVEWVPLPGTAEADLQVVVPAAGLLEDPPHVVAEAAISLRKSRWNNDLSTRYGLRVSPGVSEGCKPYYPLGLRQKRRDLEARPQHDRPTLSAARPPSRKD